MASSLNAYRACFKSERSGIDSHVAAAPEIQYAALWLSHLAPWPSGIEDHGRSDQHGADALHQWLTQQRQKVPDGSATAKAIDYSLNCWKALVRFIDDGVALTGYGCLGSCALSSASTISLAFMRTRYRPNRKIFRTSSDVKESSKVGFSRKAI